jgi:hypothetical protein
VKKGRSPYAKLWIGIGILILLAPLGLILPEIFRAGGAWGEWGADEIKKIAGYVPEGLKRLSELWSSPIPDYAVTGWNKGAKSYVAYIVSGIIGVVLVVALAYLFGKIIRKGDHNRDE